VAGGFAGFDAKKPGVTRWHEVSNKRFFSFREPTTTEEMGSKT